MYLLDTVVISEPRRRNPNRNVMAWLGLVAEADLFVSVVSFAEIENGIVRQRVTNPAFAHELSAWLDVTLRLYSGRVLTIDVPVARRWGQLSATLGNHSLDLAIAATAFEHRLTVVTRNVADFEPTGVSTLNPFA
jgi:predicted nucleic acid-binding protein